MAHEIRVTQQAEEDLQEITDYLYPLNEAAAQRIADKIEASYVLLSNFPYLGQSRNDLLLGLRHIVVDNYLVFYHVENDAVFIDRILHGARNLSAIFGVSDAGRN